MQPRQIKKNNTEKHILAGQENLEADQEKTWTDQEKYI